MHNTIIFASLLILVFLIMAYIRNLHLWRDKRRLELTELFLRSPVCLPAAVLPVPEDVVAEQALSPFLAAVLVKGNCSYSSAWPRHPPTPLLLQLLQSITQRQGCPLTLSCLVALGLVNPPKPAREAAAPQLPTGTPPGAQGTIWRVGAGGTLSAPEDIHVIWQEQQPALPSIRVIWR